MCSMVHRHHSSSMAAARFCSRGSGTPADDIVYPETTGAATVATVKPTASSGTYYVSGSNGSARNTGKSWDSPFKTIADAIVHGASVVFVEEGVYDSLLGDDPNVELERSCTIYGGWYRTPSGYDRNTLEHPSTITSDIVLPAGSITLVGFVLDDIDVHGSYEWKTTTTGLYDGYAARLRLIGVLSSRCDFEGVSIDRSTLYAPVFSSTVSEDEYFIKQGVKVHVTGYVDLTDTYINGTESDLAASCDLGAGCTLSNCNIPSVSSISGITLEDCTIGTVLDSHNGTVVRCTVGKLANAYSMTVRDSEIEVLDTRDMNYTSYAGYTGSTGGYRTTNIKVYNCDIDTLVGGLYKALVVNASVGGLANYLDGETGRSNIRYNIVDSTVIRTTLTLPDVIGIYNTLLFMCDVTGTYTREESKVYATLDGQDYIRLKDVGSTGFVGPSASLNGTAFDADNYKPTESSVLRNAGRAVSYYAYRSTDVEKDMVPVFTTGTRNIGYFTDVAAGDPVYYN